MSKADAAAPAKNRIQPIVAWRAMQILLKDKEDTAQVFRIIRALGGGEFKRNFRRFQASEPGQRILSDRRELVDTLADRDLLAAMPDGSLGRTYLNFVLAEDISADGLVDASKDGGEADTETDEDMNLLRRRVRDMHDLWHVVTGYGRDELGELALLAFTYSQLRNLGVRFIIAMGQRKMYQSISGIDFRAVTREGFRHGNQTAWLAAMDWEALLEHPLDEVRTLIGFKEPVLYNHAVARLKEYRAAGYDPDASEALQAAA